MKSPKINLLCPAALAGFVFRALAGEANPHDAALTQRRLEDLQMEKTELMLTRSAMKSDIQTAQQRVLDAEQDIRETRLDLQIFNDKNPPPQRRKGLFGTRLSRDQKVIEQRRLELENIHKTCAEDFVELRRNVDGNAKNQQIQDQTLQSILDRQEQLKNVFASQVAADVIVKVIAGEIKGARIQMSHARQMSRGNMIIGMLSVVIELLLDDKRSARRALVDARLIFEQNRDPIPAVLDQLITLIESKTALGKSVRRYSADAFSSPQLCFFSQLVSTLSGFPPVDNKPECIAFLSTLEAIHEVNCSVSPPSGWQEPSPDALLQMSSDSDLVVRVLLSCALLMRGQKELLLDASGISQMSQFQFDPKQNRLPPLLDLTQCIPNPAWPSALSEVWQVSLACFTLLGAQDNVPQAVFDSWLEESYGWQKCDLYWWTLAEIKQDKTLLNNISGSPDELFAVTPV